MAATTPVRSQTLIARSAGTFVSGKISADQVSKVAAQWSAIIRGAAMCFAIKFAAKASGLKPSSTSRHSLTFRSSRHQRLSAVGSLRATRSGAAYLGR